MVLPISDPSIVMIVEVLHFREKIGICLIGCKCASYSRIQGLEQPTLLTALPEAHYASERIARRHRNFEAILVPHGVALHLPPWWSFP